MKRLQAGANSDLWDRHLNHRSASWRDLSAPSAGRCVYRMLSSWTACWRRCRRKTSVWVRSTAMVASDGMMIAKVWASRSAASMLLLQHRSVIQAPTSSRRHPQDSRAPCGSEHGESIRRSAKSACRSRDGDRRAVFRQCGCECGGSVRVKKRRERGGSGKLL